MTLGTYNEYRYLRCTGPSRPRQELSFSWASRHPHVWLCKGPASLFSFVSPIVYIFFLYLVWAIFILHAQYLTVPVYFFLLSINFYCKL